jgi:hypothetical protein
LLLFFPLFAPAWVTNTGLAILLVSYLLWVRSRTRAWTRSTEDLSLAEAHLNVAAAMNPWLHWCLVFASSVAFALSLLALVAKPRLWFVFVPGAVLLACFTFFLARARLKATA